MKHSRSDRKNSLRSRGFLIKSLLLLASTAVIVYFMPHHNSFNYSYELGQPWHHETLISTHKFNIQMSDSALIRGRDSISQVFEPYFYLSPASSLSKPGARTSPLLVMASSSVDSLRHNGTSAIRVIENNIARTEPLSSVLTPKQAYELTSDSLLSAVNLHYDADKSTAELEEELRHMSLSMGHVQVNEKIVDRGEIITTDIYQKLLSYEQVLLHEESENSSLYLSLLGRTVMVLFILGILITYLSIYRADYISNPRASITAFSLITLMCVLASVIVSHELCHIFILPCCMVPIILRVFLDSRTAFAFHIGMVLIISLTLADPYEFTILQMVTGLVAILNLRELSQRSQIISTALYITLTYIVFYSAYLLCVGNSLTSSTLTFFLFFAINGLLLLFVYPFIWLMEKTFGFVSDVTLVELSNINHPLLRRLSEEAPGTFQHSLQVANLAADVAKKIGARVQLVRTGALYHDIGKTDRPAFFTENQSGGYTPHKHLPPQRSAEVIIAHVPKGIALANQYQLPDAIKQFIATHHGLSATRYFLVTYRNSHPDEDFDEAPFHYPGPNPSTREEAILMMADAVEAASRSLNEYTEDTISQLVDKLIDTQVADGLFANCPLTFRDISEAKTEFKKRLTTIYHTRISYPELNQ